MDVPITGSSGTSIAYTLKIYSDASGNHNSDVGSLSTQSPINSAIATTLQHNASGNSINLSSSTTYHVVLEITAAPSSTAKYERTNTNSEDSGGNTVWSLADTSRWKNWNTGSCRHPDQSVDIDRQHQYVHRARQHHAFGQHGALCGHIERVSR